MIYPDTEKFNYLEEYSRHYNTVEIDQWFWSLFDKVILPQPEIVNNYASSVPEDFLFTIKVPNSLTLTHYYKSTKKNPHFLSNDLFEQFLSSIGPLLDKTGTLMFQFEYMNKEKMGSVDQFMNCFRNFIEGIPPNAPPISVEIRNPYYLNKKWFSFLSGLGVSHVFMEGYYMPPVSELYAKHKDSISNYSVLRLHGPDRSRIEELSNKEWNQVYFDRSEGLKAIAELIQDLQERVALIYVNVNNHYEGSAPLTIKRLKELLNIPPAADLI